MYALAVADLLFEVISDSISRIENFAKKLRCLERILKFFREVRLELVKLLKTKAKISCLT
jgi:hypothetical protein